MARHVWFSLIPTNEASEAIVNDARNHEHVAIVFEPEAASGKIIQVYFGNNLTSNCILSFGRHLECNILCDPPGTAIGRQMSQIHCSFLLSNGCLILRDYSGRCKTTISPVHLNYPGKWHMDGLPRQRAIPEHGDWHISVGPATFLLRFRQDARWWERNLDEKNAIAARIVLDADALTDSPDDPELSTQPRYETRIQEPHVPRDRWHVAIVYHELEKIGKGAIGSVSRVMDLQSGRILAVKIIPVEDGREKVLKEMARREVELIARYRHTHIVDFVHSQGWKMGFPVEIFMPVADGSLRQYSSTQMEREDVVLMSRQIISALQYLHREGIVHRDIKPENILYENRATGLTFLLADFGYATRIESEKISFVGTQIYCAPVLVSSAQNNFGLDIWSLGVVIYEISRGSNLARISGLPDRTLAPEAWCDRLASACRNGGDLAKMVTLDIHNRATAKDLHASPSFPVVPADLPCIFTLPEIGVPTT